jgi:Na+/melibiose symporter-like transporter
MSTTAADSRPIESSRAEKVFFGSGWFAYALLHIASLQFIIFYYDKVLGADLVKVALAILIGRLSDAVTDPIMGWISDATRSRFGRRRPYIGIGGVLWAALMYCLINPPQAVRADETTLLVYLAGIMVLENIFQTILVVPYAAMGVDLTHNPRERVFLAGLRNWSFSAGKALSMLLIRPLLKGKRFEEIYPEAILYFSLFMAFIILLPAFFCKERVKAVENEDVGSPWQDFRESLRADRGLKNPASGLALSSLVWVVVLIAILYSAIADADWLRRIPGWNMSPKIALAGFTISVVAVCFAPIVFFGIVLLVRGKRKSVQALENLSSVLTNVPFILMSLAFFISLLGLQVSGQMLPYLAEHHLGGAHAAPDILFIVYVTPILAIPCWLWLARLIGMKRTFLSMMGLQIAIFCVSYWMVVPSESPLILFDFHLRVPFREAPVHLYYALLFGISMITWTMAMGVVMAGQMVLLSAIIPDVVDYDTLRTGQNRAGIFFGVESFAIKFGGAPSQVITASLVALSGVSANSATPEAVVNMRICFTLAPMITGVIAFIIFLFYSLTPKRVADVRRQLREAEKTRV